VRPRARRIVVILAWLPILAGCQDRQSSSRPLTSVGQIRHLAEAQLGQGLPVQLDGTITYCDETRRLMVFQDQSGGIPVEVQARHLEVLRGDRVQLAGFTAVEGYSPIIVKPRLTRLSRGRLPRAIPASPEPLFRGELDYLLVEAEGEVVRQWPLSYFGLELLVADRRVRVFGAEYLSAPLDSLLHGRIRLRGVAVSSYTPDKKVHSVQIFAGADDDFQWAGRPGVSPAGRSDSEHVAAGTQVRTSGEVTSVRQVKAIPIETAHSGFPVRIRAVVTNWDPARFGFFVQDETAGIYVVPPATHDPRLGFGQQVEIEGKSERGAFAAVIRPESVKVVGRGTVPAALPVIPGAGFTGKEENSWVELDGVITVGRPDPAGGLQFQLSCGEVAVTVILQAHPPSLSPDQLEDRRVRVQGVYAPIFTTSEVLSGFQLLTPSLGYIRVLESSGGDTFLSPPRTIRSLSGFHPEGFPRHRVRFDGQVTFKGSDGSLFVADETGGIRVVPRTEDSIGIGDPVQLLGYLARTLPEPVVEFAQVRKGMLEAKISPVEIHAEDASSGLYHGRLIRLEAFLRERYTTLGDRHLLLTSGRHTFSALLEHPRPFSSWEELRPGARLQLTGVSQFYWNEKGIPPIPASFRLLLRTPDDIVILQSAPWWTLERALLVLTALTGVLGGAVVWLTLMKRRLGAQQVLLHSQMQQREALEASLLQSQKLESIGRLAGGVAHDFNNLLTVISGYCELLRRQLAGQPGPLSRVDEIRRAGEKAAALTRQLLAFSRKQVMQPVVMDLNQLVRELDSMLGRIIGEDIERVTRLAPEPCRAKVDPGQMSQVLINLAVNARDAMPNGGKLIIETQRTFMDDRYAGGLSEVVPGEYIQLTVSDTGVGMDEETRRHLFEPFFTTKGAGRGTGLGLATVFGIVTQSAGYIWVYSEAGIGSTFKIYLPTTFEAEAPASQEAAPTTTEGNETILVVEDQPEVRQLIVTGLSSLGYRPLGAASADEALRSAPEHPGPIHLLLTDVVMPGLSGKDLAERLVQMRPGLRVLYMSGYTADVIAHKGILDAEVKYIEKPFSPQMLARRIREVLEAR
jgi:signal transduction histidine kinase/CheY-like chemotaxis protein